MQLRKKVVNKARYFIKVLYFRYFVDPEAKYYITDLRNPTYKYGVLLGVEEIQLDIKQIADVIKRILDYHFDEMVLELYTRALAGNTEIYSGIFVNENKGEITLLSQENVGKTTKVGVPLNKVTVLMLIKMYEIYPFVCIHNHPEIEYNLIYSPNDFKTFWYLMFPYAVLIFPRADEVHYLYTDFTNALLDPKFPDKVKAYDDALKDANNEIEARKIMEAFCERNRIKILDVCIKE